MTDEQILAFEKGDPSGHKDTTADEPDDPGQVKTEQPEAEQPETPLETAKKEEEKAKIENTKAKIENTEAKTEATKEKTKKLKDEIEQDKGGAGANKQGAYASQDLYSSATTTNAPKIETSDAILNLLDGMGSSVGKFLTTMNTHLMGIFSKPVSHCVAMSQVVSQLGNQTSRKISRMYQKYGGKIQPGSFKSKVFGKQLTDEVAGSEAFLNAFTYTPSQLKTFRSQDLIDCVNHLNRMFYTSPGSDGLKLSDGTSFRAYDNMGSPVDNLGLEDMTYFLNGDPTCGSRYTKVVAVDSSGKEREIGDSERKQAKSFVSDAHTAYNILQEQLRVNGPSLKSQMALDREEEKRRERLKREAGHAAYEKLKDEGRGNDVQVFAYDLGVFDEHGMFSVKFRTDKNFDKAVANAAHEKIEEGLKFDPQYLETSEGQRYQALFDIARLCHNANASRETDANKGKGNRAQYEARINAYLDDGNTMKLLGDKLVDFSGYDPDNPEQEQTVQELDLPQANPDARATWTDLAEYIKYDKKLTVADADQADAEVLQRASALAHSRDANISSMLYMGALQNEVLDAQGNPIISDDDFVTRIKSGDISREMIPDAAHGAHSIATNLLNSYIDPVSGDDLALLWQRAQSDYKCLRKYSGIYEFARMDLNSVASSTEFAKEVFRNATVMIDWRWDAKSGQIVTIPPQAMTLAQAQSWINKIKKVQQSNKLPANSAAQLKNLVDSEQKKINSTFNTRATNLNPILKLQRKVRMELAPELAITTAEMFKNAARIGMDDLQWKELQDKYLAYVHSGVGGGVDLDYDANGNALPLTKQDVMVAADGTKYVMYRDGVTKLKMPYPVEPSLGSDAALKAFLNCYDRILEFAQPSAKFGTYALASEKENVRKMMPGSNLFEGRPLARAMIHTGVDCTAKIVYDQLPSFGVGETELKRVDDEASKYLPRNEIKYDPDNTEKMDLCFDGLRYTLAYMGSQMDSHVRSGFTTKRVLGDGIRGLRYVYEERLNKGKIANPYLMKYARTFFGKTKPQPVLSTGAYPVNRKLSNTKWKSKAHPRDVINTLSGIIQDAENQSNAYDRAQALNAAYKLCKDVFVSINTIHTREMSRKETPTYSEEEVLDKKGNVKGYRRVADYRVADQDPSKLVRDTILEPQANPSTKFTSSLFVRWGIFGMNIRGNPIIFETKQKKSP